MSARGVFFQVLGPLAVSVGGQVTRPPRSQVMQGLLGVLLLARGEPLSPDRLAELVWTDRAPNTSRESVHVGVSRLRKWLARIDTAGRNDFTISYENGYLLPCAAECSDLGRFLSLAAEARTLATPKDRYEMLASAFAERKGRLLAGLTRVDRADSLLKGLEHEIRRAALAFADAARAAGDPQGALGAVTMLAEERPFDEPLHAALIGLLMASGQPAEALRAYRRLSERLSVELGVEPSEEVQEAHLSVLAADRPLHPSDQAEEAAVPPPAQLPPDTPDFTGRVDEIAELTTALTGDTLPGDTAARRTVAIAAVTGMGGMGKTTLVVHVAHRIAAHFPDGQLHVDLQGDSAGPVDPGEVLSRFLRTLGVPGAGVPPSVDERVALYRSRIAGRRMLVVLDNAAGEAQVRPLLPGAPGAAVLVTSRNRLVGLEGAHLLSLDGLPPHQALDLIGNIAGRARVAAEPRTAAEIARLCGHVPLAVRIASARLLGRRHWKLAHLAELLREERCRLDELAIGDLRVRAGFEMSYRLLPAATRRAFRTIGLLDAPDVASWTVAVLLDVPAAAARRHVEALVDAHLLTAVGPDETGQLRYKIHDLLRLYARELAEREDSEAERAAAIQRALGGWLALAEKAAERVPGPCYASMHGTAPRRPLTAAATENLLANPLRWFHAERAALLAEVGQACDLGLGEFAWDLAASMERFCDVSGLHDDWRQLHERVLAVCRANGDRRGEAVLLRGLLEISTWTSPAGTGAAMTGIGRMSARLLDLFTELDDPVGMVDALVGMVWGEVAEGRDREALVLAGRALRIAQGAGYLGGQARTLHAMAIAHGEAQPHAARECLKQALVAAQDIGDPRLVATIVQVLGAAQALCGDIEGGGRLLQESIVMARDLDDRYLETLSVLHLAKLYFLTGDGRARSTIELALDFSQSVSQAGTVRHHLAEALGLLGELNLSEGDVPGALAYLEQSARVWRTRGWVPHLARTLCTLGDAHAASGNPREAGALWAEAREMFVSLDDGAGQASIERRLRSTPSDQPTRIPTNG